MSGYRIVYEQGPPPGHPMGEKEAYLRRLDLRESRCIQLGQKPIPPGHTGLIVEVNTSLRWCIERPQLVLGNVEERARLLVKPGFSLRDGPQAFHVAREAVFVEYAAPPGLPPLTVYTDDRIDVEVASIEHATEFGDVPQYAAPRDRLDDTRLHQRKGIRVKKGQRFRRQGWNASEGRGRAYATDGELLPVSATYRGQPLWSHMLVRLIVAPDFPLTIARTFRGERSSFSPDEAFLEMRSATGICYDILFTPKEF